MKIKTRKRNAGGYVSKVLLGNKIEAASVLPGAKYINVFDGYKESHIPNTEANRLQLNKKFGKPSTSNYRGKGRKTWVDHSIYD